MSQEYTMIFEQRLDADGNMLETKAVHPQALELQAKVREGQAYQPSKMPPKDMVYVKGERTSDGDFIVTDISRSGTTATKLAQNLYGDGPEVAEISKDEKEELFAAFEKPESIEIEGRTFSVGGPLSGEITDLEKASSREALKLVSDAEKNMGLSLHMEHNTIEAVRREEALARMARNAEPEHAEPVQSQAMDESIRFGVSSKGEYFSDIVAQGSKAPEGANTVTLSFKKNSQDQPVISDIHLEGRYFESEARRMHGENADIKAALHPEEAEVFSINLKAGNTMHEAYVMNEKLEQMGPEGKAMVEGVVSSYERLAGEKLRTLAEHGKDLEEAPKRMDAREANQMGFGNDAR